MRMISAPQIRLRTIFLLFFCAAVGLTTSSNPIGAIGPTIETAIVIGLLQQAWQLLFWRTSECNLNTELSFARRFAILWRVAVAMILGACVIWQLLLARKFVASPEPSELLLIDPLGQGLSQLCVLIALCNSLMRWRLARSPISVGAIRTPFLWALAIAITVFMLIDGTTVEFLVHRAVLNVERSQKFRRTGLYIQLSAEGYDAIWFGLGAIVCLFGAIALVIHLRDRLYWPSVRPYKWLLFLLLAIPSAAFCVWYYCYEFYRLSPDMAGVGLGLRRFDLITGGLLAAIAVTAGSYLLAVESEPATTITADLSVDLAQKSFYESFLVLVLLALSAGWSILYLAWEILKYDPMLGTFTVGRFISFFCYPTSLLLLATVAATIQLCWARWKTRSEAVLWILHALSPRRFCESWIMLALLVVVGIPTVRAFVFLLWLGPFNLPSLFGF
jgi:hypothetical protein